MKAPLDKDEILEAIEYLSKTFLDTQSLRDFSTVLVERDGICFQIMITEIPVTHFETRRELNARR